MSLLKNRIAGGLAVLTITPALSLLQNSKSIKIWFAPIDKNIKVTINVPVVEVGNKPLKLEFGGFEYLILTNPNHYGFHSIQIHSTSCKWKRQRLGYKRCFCVLARHFFLIQNFPKK